SSSSPPVSAPPPRYRRESSPMAPVDRLLRADRPSQTVPPAACPHQRTPVAPSWPPRIIAVTSEIRTGQRQELFFEAPINHRQRHLDWAVVTAQLRQFARLRQLVTPFGCSSKHWQP